MTTLVLLIWGTPNEVKPMPASPAMSCAQTKSLSLTRGGNGDASRGPKRACLREQSPASNLDAATGIAGVTVRQLAWFLLECVQWVAVNGESTVVLRQKPSNAVERCVGEWLRDDDGTDFYFPAGDDVGKYSGFYTEEEIDGSGWQIGYVVKKDLSPGKRELAEAIAKAPAAYCNYVMLIEADYMDALPQFGSVMANNMGRGWNFNPQEEVFKMYVGKDVPNATWDYATSPRLGTFTATPRKRSSATAQCNAGAWSSRVEVTCEHEVRKGAPGGVVIFSQEPGKFPLARGSVFALTFSLCNSTSVAERAIAHEDTCCVCFDRPPVQLKAGEKLACPQGQNGVCEVCLLKLYRKGQPCPLCRQPWTAEAVAPIHARAEAEAKAKLAAWKAAEQEREAAEAAARAAAEERRLSEKVDPEILERLVREGFANKDARTALDLSDNDFERAKLWLVKHPLGLLCSKYGVERDGRFWTTVAKMEEVEQQSVLRELHEVDVPGETAEKWLLRVSVTLHNGSSDENGKVLYASFVSKTLRYYKVEPELIIKVSICNWSTKQIHFTPVYIPGQGSEEPETTRDLKANGEELEMPQNLRMLEGEAPDAWGLMDTDGNKVFKVVFGVADYAS